MKCVNTDANSLILKNEILTLKTSLVNLTNVVNNISSSSLDLANPLNYTANLHNEFTNQSLVDREFVVDYVSENSPESFYQVVSLNLAQNPSFVIEQGELIPVVIFLGTGNFSIGTTPSGQDVVALENYTTSSNLIAVNYYHTGANITLHVTGVGNLYVHKILNMS